MSSSAATWVFGFLGVGAVVGLIYAATKKPAAAATPPTPTPPPAPPPPRLLPGHRYEFVAMNQNKVAKAALVTALEGAGWKNPVIYLYGDPYMPSGIVWPPIADKAMVYAASAVWNGSEQEIPPGVVQLIDKGSEVVGGGGISSDAKIYADARYWTGDSWQAIEAGYMTSAHLHAIQNSVGSAFTTFWWIWRNGGWYHEEIAPGGQFAISV